MGASPRGTGCEAAAKDRVGFAHHGGRDALWSSTLAAALTIEMVGWTAEWVSLVTVMAAFALLASVPLLREAMFGSRARHRLPKALTSTAVLLAGRRRASDSEAWRAHLLGPTEGRTPTPRQQLWMSLGFLVAAIKMRWRDACRQICRPAD